MESIGGVLMVDLGDCVLSGEVWVFVRNVYSIISRDDLSICIDSFESLFGKISHG